MSGLLRAFGLGALGCEIGFFWVLMRHEYFGVCRFCVFCVGFFLGFLGFCCLVILRCVCLDGFAGGPCLWFSACVFFCRWLIYLWVFVCWSLSRLWVLHVCLVGTFALCSAYVGFALGLVELWIWIFLRGWYNIGISVFVGIVGGGVFFWDWLGVA